MTAKIGQGWTIDFGALTGSLEGVGTFEFGAVAPRVDVTSHSSTGGTREYIAGLLDPTEITTPVYWDMNDADHVELYVIQGDSTQSDTLTFTEPDASASYTATAYVAGIVIHADATGAAEVADIHWQTTGPFSLASS